MTLPAALCEAVAFIRENTEQRELLAAARELERKAERMRARLEKPAMWPHRCACGEPREAKALVCLLCHRLIPMQVLIDFHTGRGRVRTRAMNQIRLVCETRAASEEIRTAA